MFSYEKTKRTSHKQFGLIFTRKAKKTHTDQVIPQVFLPCLKRSAPQTLESSSYKQLFAKCVCHW